MSPKNSLFGRMRKRERMLVGLAAAALVVYSLAILMVLPGVRKYRLNGMLIEDKERILTGYRETLNKEKLLKKKLAAVGKALESYDQYLIAKETPDLAAAELSKRMKDASQTHKLDIPSEKTGNFPKEEHYTTIPVEITATGGIGPLKDFLYDIETGSPLLNIPEITVRSNKRRTFDAASKKYLDVDEIQATILVNGYMKGGK